MLDLDRRDAAKLLLASAAITASAGAAPAKPGPGQLLLDRALVEWKVDPVGIATRRPRFRWTCRARDAGARGMMQSGFRLQVLGSAGSGGAGEILFDSGFLPSAATTWQSAGDLPLRSQADYEWRLTLRDGDGRDSAEVRAGGFTTGIISDGDWRSRWIAAEPDSDAMGPGGGDGLGEAREAGSVLPIFRHDFSCERPIVRAWLSIAGLGQYRCLLNGAGVSPDGVTSGWSDYRKTVLYDSYDVTAHIRRGGNALAVILGHGFYNVEHVRDRYTKLIARFGQPKLIAQLRLLFQDGSEQIVTSDGEWRTRPGPVVYSSIFGGEDHDARRTPPDWATAAPNADWAPVLTVSGPGGRLTANGVPPVRVMRTIAPIAVSEPRPGVFVFDYGLNFAGRPQLTLKDAQADQTVRMWPGELLLADGTVDQASMTGFKPGLNGIRFTYIAREQAIQTWQPGFTYTGYRYLQVEGAARAQIAELLGCVIHADLDEIGRFDCSDKQLVRIHGLITQALVSNMASVLTDCPHREKLGWLEQIYLNAPTVTYNRDAATLYEKMAADMRDAQQPSGMMPSIAPEFTAFVDKNGRDSSFRDTPEWGSAVVLAAWATYRTYGDAGILRENWPAMKRFADYLAGRAGDDGLVNYGLGDWYDIGPKPPGVSQLTSKAMTGTATLYADLMAMSLIARVVGTRADAAAYAARAERLRTTINTRLYDQAKGHYDRGSQCANAMALALGLPPERERPRVLKALIDDIRARQDHVSAGDIGFHYVVRALSEAGRSDVLYAMLQRIDRPSYGHQLANGATALTEAWDAYSRSSQNHFMLGHIESWFFGGLGGVTVDCASDGSAVRIAPQPVAGIEYVKINFRSVFGPVAASWRREQSALVVEVEIPAAASARVTLPTSDPRNVREGATSLGRARSVRAVSATDGAITVDIGSGRYRFTAPI